MIDWLSLLTVGVASIVAACVVVTLYATGVRLLAWSREGALPRAKRAGAIACFVLCAIAVLFGIYLIVPALHGG